MKLNEIRRAVMSALGDDARCECDLVISHVYGISASDIPLRLFDEFEYDASLDGIIARRTSGEPLEYIIGRTVFCGLDFFVSPDCLIPQADTEVVAEEASKLLSGGRFLDLCTGSGCIAVFLAKRGARGVAVDISKAALDIAKKNAMQNGVSDLIEFKNADVFAPLDIGAGFDVIVSNPPYVRSGEIDALPPEVRHEPRIALDGGDDGLKFYRRIASLAGDLLSPRGALVIEIGYDEAASVTKILSRHGFSCRVIKDFGGNDRCVVAEKTDRRDT